MGRGGTGVRAVSDSSIEITFTHRGVRCRERIKLQPTPANLKRAERHRAAIVHAIETGTFDYAVTFPLSERRKLFAERQGEVTTVTAYLDGWITKQERHLKRSTWDDYRKIVNHTLIPAFGMLTLAELRRPVIRAWCGEQTCSNKRLANIQSVLRKAMQDALDDELIEQKHLSE